MVLHQDKMQRQEKPLLAVLLTPLPLAGWNSAMVRLTLIMSGQPELLAACEDAIIGLYDAMHAGHLSRDYSDSVISHIEAAITKATK